jgi:hypothetical protein
MNYNIVSYLIYLPVSVALTIWVGNTLFKNGRIFLLEIFNGNHEFADSVNKLLLMGFYLINFGYALYTLETWRSLESTQELIENLSVKTGGIVIILGLMHFFNLLVLFKMRKRARQAQLQEELG